MEAVGGLFVLVGLGLFLVALVALFRPIPKLKLGTRGRAGLALVGSVVLFIVGGSLLPEVEPSAATATPALKPADVKAETKALWTELTEAVGGCDKASNEVAAIFEKSRDLYELYPVVKSASGACMEAAVGLGKLKVPESTQGDTRKDFEEALERCSAAYALKGAGYSQMAKVLDGDHRPSQVSDAMETMQTANAGQWACVAGFFAAADKAGVPLGEIGEAKKG